MLKIAKKYEIWFFIGNPLKGIVFNILLMGRSDFSCFFNFS